jgi:hypothetical protein
LEREEFRDLGVRDETELARIKAEVSDSNLYNEDLAPTGPEERTWTTYNIAALWIGMSIVITTYLLAAGLMAAGMNWWQALLTISLGNIIVLNPMLLNAHAGTKYGVPFPVFVRASFGVRGELRGHSPRAGRLRLVWHPDLARRRRPRRPRERRLERLAERAPAHLHSLLRLLGHTGRDHLVRRRGCQVVRVPLRAAPDRRQHSAPDLGLLRGRRRRQRLRDLGATATGPGAILGDLLAVSGGERGILDHALPQHTGLHPLRPEPAFPGPRAGPREGLYNYALFFTFFVAGLAYLLLNMIPGRASQPRREPEAT